MLLHPTVWWLFNKHNHIRNTLHWGKKLRFALKTWEWIQHRIFTLLTDVSSSVFRVRSKTEAKNSWIEMNIYILYAARGNNARVSIAWGEIAYYPGELTSPLRKLQTHTAWVVGGTRVAQQRQHWRERGDAMFIMCVYTSSSVKPSGDKSMNGRSSYRQGYITSSDIYRI